MVAAMVVLVAVAAIGASYVLSLAPKTVTSTTTTQIASTTSTTSSASTASYSTSSSSTSSSTSQFVTTSSTQTSTRVTTTSSSSSQPISHVIIILMENEEFGSVIGSASAPYQNSLASTYALAGAYFGVAHPSLPNYLALVAGSTFGVNSDCLPAQCTLPSNVTTIATLLDSHHLSWKEYAESVPANCSQVNSPDGLYFPKHVPFVYFSSITGNNGTGSPSAYCDSHVVSMDQFYLDLQSGDLPNYSFITPNILDDAHSAPLATGDQWLSVLVPKIISSSSFATSALFIVYDEGATSDLAGGGGQVPCILVSPFAKADYVSNVEYSHYSLLATVEKLLGLGTLGRNDSTAAPMSDLFTSQANISG
jgi:phospholipase C